MGVGRLVRHWPQLLSRRPCEQRPGRCPHQAWRRATPQGAPTPAKSFRGDPRLKWGSPEIATVSFGVRELGART